MPIGNQERCEMEGKHWLAWANQCVTNQEYNNAVACESVPGYQWSWGFAGGASNCFYAGAGDPTPEPTPPVGPVGPTGPQGPSTPLPPSTPPPGASLIPGFDWLVEHLDALRNLVASKAAEAAADVTRIANEIRAAVAAKVDDASKAVSNAMGQLGTALNDLTKDLIPNTIALIGTALGGIETLIATIMSNQADIGDIGDFVLGMFSDNKTGLGDFFMDLFVGDTFNLAGEIGGKIAGALTPDQSAFAEATEKLLAMMPEFRPVEF